MNRKSIVTSNEESLQQMFILPSTLIRTSGTQEGIVLKFKTFYLKIYDGDGEESYLVKGFRYKNPKPIIEETIKTSDFRRYARKFDREDGLLSLQEPCGDPNCPILVHHNYNPTY